MRFNSEDEYQEFLRGRTASFLQVKSALEFSAAVKVEKPSKAKTGSGPNKTEAEYGRLLALEFPHAVVRYEAVTITMSNSHRYTADWVVYCNDAPNVLLVEVKARGKNGFRHPSYQRAKLAFDQCCQEFGCFRYRWAEKQEGKWNVTDY